MRILYVSSEVGPFARTGGLGDVAGALPKSLAALGHETFVAMPFYQDVKDGPWVIEPLGKEVTVEMDGLPYPSKILTAKLPDSDVQIFFLAGDAFFEREGLYTYSAGDYGDNLERFAFFCRAVLEMVKALELRIDIFHVNDWQTSLIPVYLKTLYAKEETLQQASTLLTIHNMAYQGIFPAERFVATGLPETAFRTDALEFFDKINLLKGGIVYADAINAVSETYAQEIRTPEQGCGLEGVLERRAADLSGILNGIDDGIWDTSTDPLIAENYSADNLSGKLACKRALQKRCRLLQVDVPLIGIVTRLTDQKGLELLDPIVKELMKYEFQLVLLGNGDGTYEKFFKKLQRQFSSRICVHIGFNNRLAHEIEAGSDLYLMPSRFEPCGLNQMYSLAYGAVPIVRNTGGLADTVVDYTPEGLQSGLANGFVFDAFEPAAMLDALARAFELYRDKPAWTRLMQNGMRHDFSWRVSAQKYAALYKKLKTRAAEKA